MNKVAEASAAYFLSRAYARGKYLTEIPKESPKSLCIVAIAYSFAISYDYPTKSI